ncbi:MAG TPA: GNAT family N-acetyltransferase [Myxococcaceae bacterium]|nr:GNAT family N-acetyltransferase [Myxococcaceae bacterium]
MARPPPAGIEISTDQARLDVGLIHDFLRGSYWAAGIPRDIVERSIGSSLCFGAYDGSAQVGFTRVVTDRATFAWVCDVFVVESHRRRGIADALMSTVMAHPDLQGLRRWNLATRDMHALYQRHGFQMADAERAMEIRRPDIYLRGAASGAQGKLQR